MGYRRNKIQAFLNLAGTVGAIVSIFLPDGGARVTVLAVSVVLIGLGKK